MTALLARRPQRQFTQAPAGTYHAVCVDVQNLGLQPSAWGQKHKVRLVWQLDVLDAEHDRRFDVARVYTLSLHERAALRQDLERWRGRKFTDAELDTGFDLERLIGVNCQILATQDLSDDGTTYTNVSSVLPPVKGAPKLTPRDYVRAKDRQQSHGVATRKDEEDDDIPF